ncbi:TetR/AcrR family transcriptional regulator [bacterium AH-315-F18]|nr:TetR/AcrR family transcriptional regulator [bacterium AH-315-F18]
MRVTKKTKEATRKRILQEARKLFSKKGFDAATTRDLASAADIAAGTLFNYFPSKEAIVLALSRHALDQSQKNFQAMREECETLAETLFAHVSAGLRSLKPFRPYLYPALGWALSPALRGDAVPDAEAIRVDHLEVVEGVLQDYGILDVAGPVALHLYWTLFTGVVAFWAQDDSPHQEDSRALLDHSMAMFARELSTKGDL